MAPQLGTSLAFGILENGGAVELLPVEPPKYGLGYWLAENAYTPDSTGTSPRLEILCNRCSSGLSTNVGAVMTLPEDGRRRRLVAGGYVLAVTALGVVAWYPGQSEAWAYVLVLVLCAPLTAITYPLFFLVVGLTVHPPDDGPWIFYVAWWAVVAVVQALVVVRILDRRGQIVATGGR